MSPSPSHNRWRAKRHVYASVKKKKERLKIFVSQALFLRKPLEKLKLIYT